MRLILTGIIFLGGMLFTYMGFDFLIRPDGAGAGLGIGALTTTGIAAIRGDMTAFFLITGLSMLYGSWKRNGDILLIPAFMLGCALFGRTITFFVNGGEEGFFIPMMVEALFCIAALIGSRLLPHPVTDTGTGSD
ncbi:hypothetical protein [Altererythrobacter aquiaggeris]|uniref:hypothetical protein n=1 Tax=Aestuarierythrobacter aquiaggeris TaxID=1898396 RepID=UPI0030164F04